MNETAVAASEGWKTLKPLPTRTTAAHATDCQDQSLLFQDLGRRQVVADFSGGYLSSDGGALRLRQVDQNLGLTVRLAQAFTDQRDPRYCDHSVRELLAQRLLAEALGYEDLNDHDTVRRDPLLAVGATERSPGNIPSPRTARGRRAGSGVGVARGKPCRETVQPA